MISNCWPNRMGLPRGPLSRLLVTFALTALALESSSCKRDEVFPDLGSKVAGPVDVAASKTGAHFYVLNSDFDRTYNQGSVLIFDQEGAKVGTVKVPRMGRSVVVSGDYMIVTVDKQDDDSSAAILVFDISDETNPVLTQEKGISGCSPWNSAMHESSDYFFVSCTLGSLFIGSKTGAFSIKRIRRYGNPRRAMFFDHARNLLFVFATSTLVSDEISDQVLTDAATYDDTGAKVSDEPNEVPDLFEETKRAQSEKSVRRKYQFFVYDIAAEASPSDCAELGEEPGCSFPYRSLDNTVVRQETRWMYFEAANFDGSPDRTVTETAKYYRTNFWMAQPAPESPHSFYLSHRGPPTGDGSPHANHVVKVDIIGDPRATTEAIPKTSSFLQFRRVYGFKGQQSSKFHFPGDFEVSEIDAQHMMVVNHFRDLENWKAGQVYFSLASMSLDENMWFTEVSADDAKDEPSYYQVAMNDQGRIFSCSYYGNEVILLELRPGIDIRVLKKID